MHATEKLFSCASAHGIDLRQAAGECVKLYGAGSPRRRNLMERWAQGKSVDEKEIRGTALESAQTIRETARRTESRVAKPRLYSHAELGHALAGKKMGIGRKPTGGLEGPAYLAAMYSFALDGSVYDDLYRALRKSMAELADEDRWPVTVKNLSGELVHYGDDLCKLVLVHDWCRPFFMAAPALYAIYLGVSDAVWRQRLMVPYTSTQARYERWLARASGYLDHRLYEEFHG